MKLLKILIVDDEIWMRQDLKSIINWESYGFTICDEAESGADMLLKVKLHNPDLIITDIKMPDMDGLQAVEKLADLRKQIPVILLSAYGDFSYANKAVSLGAMRYLLKPVDKNELIDALEHAKKTIVKNRELTETLIKYELADKINKSGETDNNNNLMDKLTRLGMEVSGKRFIVITSKSNHKIDISLLEDNIDETYFITIFKNTVIGLIAFPEADSFGGLYKLLGAYSEKNNITVGVSSPFNNINGFLKAFNEAIVMAESRFIVGDNAGVYLYKNKLTNPLNNEILKIQTVEDANVFIDKIPQYIKLYDINMDGLYDIYCRLAKKLAISQTQYQCIIGDDFRYLSDTFTNIDEMLDFLRKMTDKQSYDFKSESSKTTVRKILEYIDENYNKKIHLGEISKEFYINPNYLSVIFKEYVGKNFTQYLMQTRIKKAKELLADDSMSIMQISQMVGYDDGFHFSKLFKKYEGCSPSEYRKKIR